jgi:hypothetical protein
MIEDGQILDGPRWIKVEPDGALAGLGDFLSSIGLDSTGTQTAAMAGIIVLVWLLSHGMKRLNGRVAVGRLAVPAYRNVTAGSDQARLPVARDARTVAPPDRSFVRQEGSARVDGATANGRATARSCAWQAAEGATGAGMTLWVCATCRATTYARGSLAPKACARAMSAAA